MISMETPTNDRKRDLPLTSPEGSESNTWKKQEDKDNQALLEKSK